MSIIWDVKAIRLKLEKMEQKVEFEEKNPPTPSWYSAPVVWSPEHGYTQPVGDEQPVCWPSTVPTADSDRLEFYQMYGLGYQGDPETN